MIGGWLPWRRLLPVWLPAVLLCLASLALYLWQSSGSLGREAQLRDQVAELETNLVSLQKAAQDAEADGMAIAVLDTELQRIYREVFGSLGDRLTDILREVESATRGAGMLPERLSYRDTINNNLDCVRFTVSFGVAGQYEQLRRMLAAVQSSPEFLIVERIAFRGEEEPTSNEIQISINLATYLAEADPEQLRLLTGQIVPASRVGDSSGGGTEAASGSASEGSSDG